MKWLRRKHEEDRYMKGYMDGYAAGVRDERAQTNREDDPYPSIQYPKVFLEGMRKKYDLRD